MPLAYLFHIKQIMSTTRDSFKLRLISNFIPRSNLFRDRLNIRLFQSTNAVFGLMVSLCDQCLIVSFDSSLAKKEVDRQTKEQGQENILKQFTTQTKT